MIETKFWKINPSEDGPSEVCGRSDRGNRNQVSGECVNDIDFLAAPRTLRQMLDPGAAGGGSKTRIREALYLFWRKVLQGHSLSLRISERPETL